MKWIVTALVAGCGLAAVSGQILLAPTQPKVAGAVEVAAAQPPPEPAPPSETTDPVSDTDGDGLNYRDETERYHTNPDSNDTDNDGYTDDVELRDGYSPRHPGNVKLAVADSDHDGLSDDLELAVGTNLLDPDTDKDGFQDGAEVYTGYDPLAPDKRAANKHVVVDISRQQLDFFIGEAKLGTIKVSTGIPSLPTPTGEFAIEKKIPVIHFWGAGYDFPNTKWNLEFLPHYYLHGAYWHNDFGKRARSHGCVNIAYKDVEKLYNFLDVGDHVTIIGETPVGYLKK